MEAQTRLDSTPQSRHQRALRRLLTGEAGSKVTFTFERADATRFTATLRRQRLRVPPIEVHRILPSGFGYLRFTEWTISLTLRALDGLNALNETPGLVIDLRGNAGGAAHAVNLMLERFYSERVETGRVITRTGKPVSLFFGTLEIMRLKRVVEGATDAYRGPVVVLMNAQSASASELFAATLQATGRAKILGQPSCGCLLGFLGYAQIPGGAELAYSEVGFELSNGKHIEGEGVVPDKLIAINPADLQVNRDRALEEAQALLATTKP
jgi:carboxyl-terminal processing protease